jgi:hypothetical protein
LKEPTGVRAAETMTTSSMGFPQGLAWPTIKLPRMRAPVNRTNKPLWFNDLIAPQPMGFCCKCAKTLDMVENVMLL